MVKAKQKGAPRDVGPVEARCEYRARQVVILLGLVLIVVVLSIGGTLYITGALAGDKGVAHRRMTLLDAQLMCERRVRDDLGRRIKTVAVDSHSSRYDEFDDRFKIFFTADLYENGARKGFPQLFYVNCYTRSDRALITTFEVSEDADFKPRPIREAKGGAFGL